MAKQPRWQCPHCKGTDVSIALPAWYHETILPPDKLSGGCLEYIQADEDADVLYWACNAEDCNGAGQGPPIDRLYASDLS